MSTPKRRNGISGQWSARLIEMLECPAYRALSQSAHRVISRIEIELAHHGGNDNGRLPVTFEDFIAYGVHHNAVAPAIREAEALGFIRVTERGRGGNAEHRQPNKFFLTFAHSRESRQSPPTHDWRRIKSLEDAIEIAQAARDGKNPRAVQFAEQRTLKTKNRYRNPVVVPAPGNRYRNRKSRAPRKR
jgi:DNA-binding transcriptional MocR family regulator